MGVVCVGLTLWPCALQVQPRWKLLRKRGGKYWFGGTPLAHTTLSPSHCHSFGVFAVRTEARPGKLLHDCSENRPIERKQDRVSCSTTAVRTDEDDKPQELKARSDERHERAFHGHLISVGYQVLSCFAGYWRLVLCS